ncbi:MAG: hypothetical protein LBP23_05290 [Treponema sp.]|nr:hypothetical protein [Treponema sp.]
MAYPCRQKLRRGLSAVLRRAVSRPCGRRRRFSRQIPPVSSWQSLGGSCRSRVNRSGFWLAESLFGTDEKLTHKTLTVPETITGGTGFIAARVIFAVFY